MFDKLRVRLDVHMIIKNSNIIIPVWEPREIDMHETETDANHHSFQDF